ncbi:CheA signal transduction histidine kinase; fused chemotactic sensory histidine kinase in two-component regulatory system with CheB and CheY: sensory histidine kinase; signal sensing protein [Planktothrix serta PCC 8927]|uniref:Chemotaxis protein CheA n=1 Tax=Planktothrix serta PCC 8927 TaxID=671068 RepID=A0A7Z9C3F2_9CYAN|nr:chemotaxis protein CheW [Planktothrix serta]VXD25052.1 CheA signal transduction histidine kinase; fused chemotactic sensory histidine kinase in two-component regulatory system with CheB and CheY: sensory histidine kinase; signal sensing protein [Planktothrix serta PCC 8927]
MSNPNNNNFFEDFLEDYFAECEEHLAVVRRELLTLESWINQSPLERSHLNELFRCFHSLKGLSGMVGVSVAEELAHQMESYLRVLRDQQIVLSSEGFDALIAGTKLLEQVITCRRTQTPAPDITDISAQLRAVIPDEHLDNPSSLVTPIEFKLKPEEQNELNTAISNGETLWHFIFSPSTQLSEQGIRVNTVREHLQTLGRLIYIAPRMSEGNKILFDLILATSVPEIPFQESDQPGLTWQPYFRAKKPETAETPRAGKDRKITETRHPTPDTHFSVNSQPSTANTLNVVRVDLPKLDDLMRMVGDLVISRARLDEDLKSIAACLRAPQIRALQEINLMLERQLRDLRQGVMEVRLVPIGEIFARMQFVVRDLVRASGKQVTLEISGQETEIDKFVVERMLDPLLHLVRNAVSHGIETPAERQQAGKNPQGTITLRATTVGETVVIEIEDDGRGVDIETVIQRVSDETHLGENTLLADKNREAGKPEPYNMMAVLDILCFAGFSTKDQADLISGRGVGMAIVKNTVQELGGSLSLDTHKGHGTQFTIQLPLTLAITDALIVNVGKQTFAIPQASVLEVLEVSTSQIITFENNEIVSYRNTILPLIRLAQIFSLSPPSITSPAPPASPIVVVGMGENSVALVVDRVTGLREIVVTPLTDPFVQVMGIAGATELGDRRVVLIVDVGALIRYSTLQTSPSPFLTANRQPPTLTPMSDLATSTQSYILFELADTLYGIPSQIVQQMEMIEQITTVPNTLPFVEGVVFSRGQVIPVINLRVRFGLEKTAYNLRTRLIVIHTNHRTIGLIVDTAREFLAISDQAIQPPPEGISPLSGRYLGGIATLGKRVILILNVEELLTNQLSV